MSRLLKFVACLLVMTFTPLVGCLSGKERDTSRSDIGEPWFVDVTAKSGIDFTHVGATQTRYWLPEIMSGGAACLDFDNDGDLDVYLVQGGDLAKREEGSVGNVLFENQGDGSFRNVTERSRVGDRNYGMGAAIGDFDRDGFDDIYVTNVGPNVLYRNRGDGTFDDVSQSAGVAHPGWGTSAAFVDYDRDGDLDLFAVNYIHWSPAREIECVNANNERDYCHPSAFHAPAIDVLYCNQGDGTFEDVTQSLGLSAAYGNGLGVTVGDFNRDGLTDLYVANDGDPNQLWLQSPDGRFRDHALLTGCAVNEVGSTEAGMGVAASDLQNDGYEELIVTHLGGESNTLYVNHERTFRDATTSWGLAAPSLPYTGFGTGFADFDHDGIVDLFVANGRVTRDFEPLVRNDAFAEPNQLFRGTAKGRFKEVFPRGGTKEPLIENSRATVFWDFDNDGDVDVLVVNNSGRATLLGNVAGQRGAWIRFQLIATPEHDVSQSKVIIEVDGQRQSRTLERAYSYLASNEPYIHFGVGDARMVDEVVVMWTPGNRESFGSFETSRQYELTMGAASKSSAN